MAADGIWYGLFMVKVSFKSVVESLLEKKLVQNFLMKCVHKKLRGLSRQANYTDQATAACQRS
jgi:hypothetical protein